MHGGSLGRATQARSSTARNRSLSRKVSSSLDCCAQLALFTMLLHVQRQCQQVQTNAHLLRCSRPAPTAETDAVAVERTSMQLHSHATNAVSSAMLRMNAAEGAQNAGVCHLKPDAVPAADPLMSSSGLASTTRGAETSHVYDTRHKGIRAEQGGSELATVCCSCSTQLHAV